MPLKELTNAVSLPTFPVTYTLMRGQSLGSYLTHATKNELRNRQRYINQYWISGTSNGSSGPLRPIKNCV